MHGVGLLVVVCHVASISSRLRDILLQTYWGYDLDL